MPSSGSGSASGDVGEAASSSLSGEGAVLVTIDEVIRACGLSPKLFNLKDADAFRALIAEQYPRCQRRLKRMVSSGVWETTDADQKAALNEALLYLIGGKIIHAAMIQSALGIGPPLLGAPPDKVKDLIDDMYEKAQEAADDAQLSQPTDEPEKLATAWSGMTQWDGDDEGRAERFTLADEW